MIISPGSTPTRNDLEEAFLAICDEAAPAPEVNAWIPIQPIGYAADFLWRPQRLIAETDGRDAHTIKRAFEHDRRRDQRLMLPGYRVVRFPRRRVFEDADSVRSTLKAPARDALEEAVAGEEEGSSAATPSHSRQSVRPTVCRRLPRYVTTRQNGAMPMTVVQA